jgi:hypothetical protein
MTKRRGVGAGTRGRRVVQARRGSSLLMDLSWRSLITVQAMATDTMDEHSVKALQVVPVLVDQLVEPCMVVSFGHSNHDKQTAICIMPLDNVGHQAGPLVEGFADVVLPSVAGEVVSKHFEIHSALSNQACLAELG